MISCPYVRRLGVPLYFSRPAHEVGFCLYPVATLALVVLAPCSEVGEMESEICVKDIEVVAKVSRNAPRLSSAFGQAVSKTETHKGGNREKE